MIPLISTSESSTRHRASDHFLGQTKCQIPGPSNFATVSQHCGFLHRSQFVTTRVLCRDQFRFRKRHPIIGCYILAPQQRLHFFPEPQGQGSFRGTAVRDTGAPTATWGWRGLGLVALARLATTARLLAEHPADEGLLCAFHLAPVRLLY
jgi:hypothetical protein